jgi:ribosomal protein S6--L-glutamate ligase
MASGGDSWIVKGRNGSKGSHVDRGPDAATTRALVRFYWGEGTNPIVQEDLGPLPVHRIFVSGNRVLAAAEATPKAGDFRSNWHRGGQFRGLDAVPPELAAIALAATQAIGLPFAGVDVIGIDDPRVLEVNASPGIEGLERATGLDLAAAVLQDLFGLR